jgi:hypothetical protein
MFLDSIPRRAGRFVSGFQSQSFWLMLLFDKVHEAFRPYIVSRFYFQLKCVAASQKYVPKSVCEQHFSDGGC